MNVQLLAINDFHGQLPAPGGTISVPNGTLRDHEDQRGGIVYLAAQRQGARGAEPEHAVPLGG